MIKLILLLICVFVVGVFFGIWMDWSVARTLILGNQSIKYDVQLYQKAMVQVAPNDQILIAGPDGGYVPGLQMNFQPYNPCKSTSAPGTCDIDPNSDSGPYFFTCSGAGYSCPDPGIQQSPTHPIEDFDFAKAVKVDFAHLVGFQPQGDKRQPSKDPINKSSAGPFTSLVSCNAQGNTQITDFEGNPVNGPLQAAKGQSVFWISPKAFTIDTSKFTSGLCSNGNPPSGSSKQVECDVSLPSQDVYYNLTAPSCKLSTFELKTTN